MSKERLIWKIVRAVIKERKFGLLFWVLVSFISTRLYYYCTLCGGWRNPVKHAFLVEEKACFICYERERLKDSVKPFDRSCETVS